MRPLQLKTETRHKTIFPVFIGGKPNLAVTPLQAHERSERPQFTLVSEFHKQVTALYGVQHLIVDITRAGGGIERIDPGENLSVIWTNNRGLLIMNSE